MEASARFDVPVGSVPDYSTFRRHVWRYRDEDTGRVVSAPPWMYSVIFEDTEEAAIAFSLIELLVTPQGTSPPMVEVQRVEVITRRGEDGAKAFEVCFADLQVLHLFLVMLASQSSVDAVSRRVGEFLMWTLGFRWV